jgi:RNA polymerase sigma-70 factor, ECF subfamily
MSIRQREFEEVALPHAPSLLRVARRLAGDASTAEDLVQETLLLGWRAFDQFERGTNVRAWLFRILFNAYYGRGRKLRSMPAIISLDDSFREPEREGRWDPVQLDSADVMRALGELSAEHRAALVLAVVEGFTCAEISKILNVPIGTVMSRLSRARQAMRQRLEKGEPECRLGRNTQWAAKGA